jgi:hypothetical protein
MGRAKKYSPEQFVNLLRQIKVGIANGKTHPAACREAGITEQTYSRWRQARRVEDPQRHRCQFESGLLLSGCGGGFLPYFLP